MFCNTLLGGGTFYYPLGNTLAVSLTQDLPPEQDADILLLGCGDARNILFTCFADAARKMDVTCCDNQPGIHARNVLLYTLLIEDKANLNVKRIWNIYYHLKIDKESVELLETQVQKLLGVSKSLDGWHSSIYGATIRFCDENSLSLVRTYWRGFQLRGLSNSKKTDRLKHLQAAYNRAKEYRKKEIGDKYIASDICATYPALNQEAMKDLETVYKHWWNSGRTPSSDSSDPNQEAAELNPLFFYSPDKTLTVNFGISPIVGFPLSTAYTQISKESPFYLERKDTSSTEYLVDGAKSHFTQWASAYRRSVENKSVIRIFCGDAIVFCWTLRNLQLSLQTPLRPIDVCSDYSANSALKLCRADYGNERSAAPLSFDIIDTSNLVDHLASLTMFGLCSSLLKYNASSSLYMETLFRQDSLSDLFGVDVHVISLLLGLVLPDLYTNAKDSFEDDLTMENMAGVYTSKARSRSRLRWKRLGQTSRKCICVCVKAKTLAKLLIQVHDTMFQYEDRSWRLKYFMLNKPIASPKPSNLSYNRASFAVLLNLLRATVVSDWDQCMGYIYDSCCSLALQAPFKNSAQDLLLQMHLYGVDNGAFNQPDLDDIHDAILAPILPFRANENIPEQLCVTVRVPREKLDVFTRIAPEKLGILALICVFEGQDSGGMPWRNIFSAVQVAYGTWHEKPNEERLYPYINEDSAHLFGTSDMFVSVYVPTLMLLQSKLSAPWVKCGVSKTSLNFINFEVDLGLDLCFARNSMTSQDVFVTRYMPGMSGLPAVSFVSAQQDPTTSATTTVQLTHDGSKVDKLIQSITLESQAAKTELAVPSSTVEIEFKSPLTAFITIAQSHELNLDFPVPVSPTKYKVRIARKSSYIEVESPLFNPLDMDAAVLLFPTFIIKASSGATVPTTWTSTRIDLDAMPPIDLKDTQAVLWVVTHASLMFSEREGHIRESRSRKRVDTRTDLKDKLFSILMHYTNLKPPHGDVFGLHKTEDDFQILIFPSCLRLDLVNHTVVLDTAILPLTKTVLDDPRAVKFSKELSADRGLIRLQVSEEENRTWKAMMPALVERCRTASTWTHAPSCEYIQTREAPLPKGLNEDCVTPICSCGIGKFPPSYLKGQTERLSDLSYLINRYATRAAIAPIFTFSFVEDCSLKSFSEKMMMDDEENCENCGKTRWAGGLVGEQGFSRCSKCKLARYCSKKCQKADWALHKVLCFPR